MYFHIVTGTQFSNKQKHILIINAHIYDITVISMRNKIQLFIHINEQSIVEMVQKRIHRFDN